MFRAFGAQASWGIGFFGFSGLAILGCLGFEILRFGMFGLSDLRIRVLGVKVFQV